MPTRLLLAALLLLPLPAWAHAILVDSQPALNDAVPPGPVHFVLRFNSRIDVARSRLVLRAGTAERVLPARPDARADAMAADTGGALAPGEYVLRWQVLAVDGHITRGDLPFTVRAP